LKYFNKRCIHESVEQQPGADEDGTSPLDIKQAMKKVGLKVTTKTKMIIRDVKSAIDKGSPVLISICSDEHYAVIYGYSTTHIFVMNSSLDASEDGVGSLKCAVPLSEFKGYWDRWDIVVC
jgi:ABC-type bacteriocin/lantibiotic exporter with double-glycine peptidase domain